VNVPNFLTRRALVMTLSLYACYGALEIVGAITVIITATEYHLPYVITVLPVTDTSEHTPP